jgi:hypothetical protein
MCYGNTCTLSVFQVNVSVQHRLQETQGFSAWHVALNLRQIGRLRSVSLPPCDAGAALQPDNDGREGKRCGLAHLLDYIEWRLHIAQKSQ